MNNINWARDANFHIQEFNSSLIPYMNYQAQGTGTVSQVEIYVDTPPTATTTIGFKKSFFGSLKCSLTIPAGDFPTGDYMVLDFATSSYVADGCRHNAGQALIFSTSIAPNTSALRIGGYTDPFFGTIVIPYFKVTTIEPWTVQNNGDMVFMLGFELFFSALLFFAIIFNIAKRL